MNNTKSLLLIAIIAATLVLGTSVLPMQSFADRDNNDDHKKTKDFKSSIIAGSESDKKSASQHQDQDNFCYRGEDCQQANDGQQIVGKDNEASGFNDQSENLAAIRSSSRRRQRHRNRKSEQHQHHHHQLVNSVSPNTLIATQSARPIKAAHQQFPTITSLATLCETAFHLDDTPYRSRSYSVFKDICERSLR